MYKLGLSTCGKEINEELFAAYSRAGITAMEISKDKDWYETADYTGIKQMADAYGVELWSLHLPFAPFRKIDISSADETFRQESVDYLVKIIKRAANAGIDKYVIHASGEPIEDAERSARIEASKKSLEVLSEVTVECSGRLAVENLPRTCLGNCGAEIKELLSVSPELRVCFDTNHLLCEDFEAFISAVGDKIITMHVSDYDFVNERHWLPGEGKMDWGRLLKCLEGIGYQGPWLYEIGFAVPKTLVRPRDLNCEDFARNARELFEGKPLTVISAMADS